MRNVSVVGAGLMGMGITQVCAQYGYPVRVRDLTEELLDRGFARSRQNLQQLVSRGKMTAEEVEQVFARITRTTRLEDVAHADLIIEAITEDTQAKRELFADLDRMAPEHTIIATNTSILSPTEIGAATARPDRTLGLHFFNPAPIMKLVEVVPGQLTSPETVETCRAFCQTLGKTPIVVKEAPGGVVSRILVAMRNEAVDCFAEGVASFEDIDTAMKLGAGFPMGPFELIDLVGIDLHVTNSESMMREMGNPKYRPHPLLRKMVRAGLYGRKSGRGFYRYDK
ncbi:MAG: 3-hydroxyacyl-CoA dehydrogenase NAD-binding domain-containing protein [Chloroflexi bacterium]|nr:3-hydroxyacyl-CoA dehydrogenase NAD-binding domain-containing protein [Chloroflexota bacterium]